MRISWYFCEKASGAAFSGAQLRSSMFNCLLRFWYRTLRGLLPKQANRTETQMVLTKDTASHTSNPD